MDGVFKFAATFKEYLLQTFSPSFVPTTIMEDTLNHIRDDREKVQ